MVRFFFFFFPHSDRYTSNTGKKEKWIKEEIVSIQKVLLLCFCIETYPVGSFVCVEVLRPSQPNGVKRGQFT